MIRFPFSCNVIFVCACVCVCVCTTICFCHNRYYQLLWWHRAGDDEVGDDRNDLSTVWISLLVWSILPNRFAINAGYTHNRRLFEDTNGRRFFCKLWGRQCSTSACLREIRNHLYHHRWIGILLSTIITITVQYNSQLNHIVPNHSFIMRRYSTPHSSNYL